MCGGSWPAGEAAMRTENSFSKMAWGERERNFRSAKWSAAMVVATSAALLIFCNSLLPSHQSPALQLRRLDTKMRAAKCRWIWRLWVALLLAWPNLACAQIVVMKNPGANVVEVVKTGKSPSSVTVNPVSNKIYVANRASSDITVIDGETNAATTVKVGFDPRAIAVNEVTN